jgi:hypothetical protein
MQSMIRRRGYRYLELSVGLVGFHELAGGNQLSGPEDDVAWNYARAGMAHRFPRHGDRRTYYYSWLVIKPVLFEIHRQGHPLTVYCGPRLVRRRGTTLIGRLSCLRKPS